MADRFKSFEGDERNEKQSEEVLNKQAVELEKNWTNWYLSSTRCAYDYYWYFDLCDYTFEKKSVIV